MYQYQTFDNLDRYYFEDVSKVELIDVIKIDKETFNKIDLIMFRYYNEASAMGYLNLILSFNNLPDITNIPIGTIFKIPDIGSLLANLIELDENEDNIVQGVNGLIVNKNESKSNQNKTVASPKLNITLPKVSYDNEKGIITY